MVALVRSFALSHPSDSTGTYLKWGVVVTVEVPVPFGSNSTMQIYGPFRVSTQPTDVTQRATPQKGVDSAPKTSAAPTDQLDLSHAAGGVNRLDSSGPVAGNGEIRIDRVAEIRRQIADGSYETPEKLDAALDRMLDQLA